MQTSLARRERRRRGASTRKPKGGAAVKRLAIIIPLILFTTIVLVGVLGVVSAVAAYNIYANNLPTAVQIKSVLENIDFSQTTRVYDRSGKIQLATFAREQRDVVTFDQIAPVLVDATTAAEDKTFWQNAGFDPVGIISAGLDTLSGRGRGASTITQQIVRNRLLPDWAKEGTVYDRKIREIIVSVRLTEVYKGDVGKQQIIAAYLNDNFYGNRSYGVSAAARGYWNKPMSKLTLAQAALLAAIPKSPTAYDLLRNAVEQENTATKDPDDTLLVVPQDSPVVLYRNRILDQMQDVAGTPSITQFTRGQFTDADFEAAKKEPVILTPPATTRMLAPQFVLQARHELGTIICPETPDECDKIDTGGYRVTTTLDWQMQKVAERWTQAAGRGPMAKNPRAYVEALSQPKVPWRSWMAHLVGQGVHNAALASIDYRTGQVYTYVGSAGFYLKGSKKFQPQFDVLEDGWRQPGSAFKPINYLVGIDDKTLTAASLFMDVVTDFGGGWTPANADPFEHGPLRLRQALMGSLNIPAIKAGIQIGPKHVWERSKDFGIRWQTKEFAAGPSLAIGTVELHIIDLISAYGAIANNGVLMPRTTILEIKDADGNKVWPVSKPKGKRIVSAAAAYVMTAMLASNTNPAENLFWGRLALRDAAGKRRPATLKTGTTNDTKDLTAMGYVAPPKDPKAPALVTGAWMGNSDNTAPPNGVFALESAATLWQDYMNAILRKTPIADFKKPKGVTTIAIDAFSGMLPGPFTTKTVQENFISGTQPNKRDNTKVGIEVDSATNKLWREGCEGPKVTKGFLDLSKVETKYKSWTKYNQGWIARAARGIGVRGGPKGSMTQPYFGNGWFPFGRTWGAPFAPTGKCPLYTPPTPSPDPSAGESPFPSEPPPSTAP